MTGIRAFYNAFTDPAAELRDMTHDARINYYGRAWMYYRSLMWGSGYDWSAELARRELYKHTRLIYNPVPMIVDFYVDNIWQAPHHETQESLATPLSEKTDEKLVEVVAQLDQWSNWLSESQKIKRYAAATGNVLVEGIDDPLRGKILHKVVWPGYVTQLELNDTGDVQSYTLEYPVYDPAIKGTYQYKKVVTKQQFQYFRDDKPFAPEGKTGAVERNVYGFCFAIWIRHSDDGADYGLPACHSLDKVDNVNSLASHVDDFIHKAIESPKIISTSNEVLPIIGAQRSADGSLANHDPRLNWMVLKTGIGATVHDLLGLLDLASVSPELARQLKSFEDDYPELQATSIIRENSQLSGAALERMLGPAQNRLDGVQTNYNQQLTKLRQMQIAVAGMRSRGGGWANLTDQQRLFQNFNLDSYGKGELDFNIKRSVLVQSTEDELEAVKGKKLERAISLGELVEMDPIVRLEEQLRIAGYADERIKELMRGSDEDAGTTLQPVINAQRLPGEPLQIGAGDEKAQEAAVA